MSVLTSALDDYLDLRRSMGFKLERAAKLLAQRNLSTILRHRLDSFSELLRSSEVQNSGVTGRLPARHGPALPWSTPTLRLAPCLIQVG